MFPACNEVPSAEAEVLLHAFLAGAVAFGFQGRHDHPGARVVLEFQDAWEYRETGK